MIDYFNKFSKQFEIKAVELITIITQVLLNNFHCRPYDLVSADFLMLLRKNTRVNFVQLRL